VFSHRQTFALTKCWSYAKEKEEKRLLPKIHIGEKKERYSWNFSKERKEIKVLLELFKEKKGKKGIIGAFQKGKMKEDAH
jgi:hypothetical protein